MKEQKKKHKVKKLKVTSNLKTSMDYQQFAEKMGVVLSALASFGN